MESSRGGPHGPGLEFRWARKDGWNLWNLQNRPNLKKRDSDAAAPQGESAAFPQYQKKIYMPFPSPQRKKSFNLSSWIHGRRLVFHYPPGKNTVAGTHAAEKNAPAQLGPEAESRTRSPQETTCRPNHSRGPPEKPFLPAKARPFLSPVAWPPKTKPICTQPYEGVSPLNLETR